MPTRHCILFAHNFPPVNTSGVQRALRFWKYLPEAGFETHVVCSSHGGVTDMERVSYVPSEYTARSTGWRAGAATLAQRVAPHNERFVWAAHAITEAERLFEQYPIDAIVSTSPAIGAHIAGHFATRRARRQRGIPWLADFRDSLTNNPFRTRTRWAVRYEHWLERRIFKSATLVTSVTDRLIDEWRELYPDLRHKMHVVWNGFDPEEQYEARPIPKRSYRALVHTGNIYGMRHPGIVLDSMSRLIAAGRLDPASVRMELIGPLTPDSPLHTMPSFLDLRDRGAAVANGKLIPRNEAMKALAEADYQLLIDLNAFDVGHTVPAKLFEYLRIGRPILALAPPDSIVENILARSEVPSVCITSSDSPEVADEKLARFFALPPDPPVRASDWFWENFDGRRQAAQIAALLEEAIGRASAQPRSAG